MIETILNAQLLLDKVHESKIFELYQLDVSDKQHIAEIKLVKQKLKIVKRQLKEEISTIKPMVRVYRLNSAMDRRTNPSSFGSNPCH